MNRVVFAVRLAALALLGARAALGTPTPAQRCQASKNKATGKYAACRENAEARFASMGDTTRYNESISKCQTKYQTAWQTAEQKAVVAGSPCTTMGDRVAVQEVTDEFTDKRRAAPQQGAAGGLPGRPDDLPE